jgi:serine/threonine protein kinase
MEIAAPIQAAPPADVIGRFRIVRMLGRGAQGAVYLASDPELGRLVAIKCLPVTGEGSQDRFGRLMREARTASGLSHPNVVPVYEVGLALDAPYVVFEYVDGLTLAQSIKSEGALTTAKAVIAMSQILAGIAHAHTKGLVHGDIKPANILLANTGVPRITDFGIARGLHDFNAQASAGTVRYMAPEHFNGGHADQRADVFALGLVFWEMLTGEPVNSGGDNTSTIYRILNDAIPKPSDKKPGVDPRLDEIVMRALDKNPDARFRDAGEMKAVLDRVRVGANGETTTQIAAEPATHSTVEFLLRRMRHKSNFPALSQRFSAINQLTSDDSDGSVQKLANLVMQDFALTHKLLQIVNSAAHGGGGNVTSVSQAIVKLGMQQVRAVASSLMLATPPQAANVHPGLHEVLLGSFVAAVVGRNIGRMTGLQNVEEAFVCSMFGPPRRDSLDLLSERRLRRSHTRRSNSGGRRNGCLALGARHRLRRTGHRSRASVEFPAQRAACHAKFAGRPACAGAVRARAHRTCRRIRTRALRCGLAHAPGGANPGAAHPRGAFSRIDTQSVHPPRAAYRTFARTRLEVLRHHRGQYTRQCTDRGAACLGPAARANTDRCARGSDGRCRQRFGDCARAGLCDSTPDRKRCQQLVSKTDRKICLISFRNRRRPIVRAPDSS